MNQQAKKAETRQVKAVFKNIINDHNTLFGGIALQWMDEVAYITATRFCRKKVVTVSTGKIDFKKPIPYGTFAEIIGTVKNYGSVKMEIKVSIFIEEKYHEKREMAVEGSFFFAAVDENNLPVRLFD
ncbi:MAG: hotdog domain-containing protein [Bacteroidales bacterium]|jgi:acyl-CoA hydrolase|nr:hotdog domain-containing protein [Bacteroidales bacterium]